MDVESTALAQISAARQALARAQDIYAVLEIRDVAKAAATLAEAKGAGEAANEAKEVQLRAERKAGAFLKTLERGGGGDRRSDQFQMSQPETFESDYAATIDNVGISRPTAHRWQKIADVPDEEFDRFVIETREAGNELTQAAALKLADKKGGTPHVSHNSGNNEWYTPPEFIKAARAVMGGIELDPASSTRANSVIGANNFYTADDDGLAQDWYGRIWMNPPYASDLVGKFTAKLAKHYTGGDVSEAIALVNNATETSWFRDLVQVAGAVVFPASRVKFWKPNGETGAPLQGQAILYLGRNPRLFLDTFKSFGWGALIDG